MSCLVLPTCDCWNCLDEPEDSHMFIFLRTAWTWMELSLVELRDLFPHEEMKHLRKNPGTTTEISQNPKTKTTGKSFRCYGNAITNPLHFSLLPFCRESSEHWDQQRNLFGWLIGRSLQLHKQHVRVHICDTRSWKAAALVLHARVEPKPCTKKITKSQKRKGSREEQTKVCESQKKTVRNFRLIFKAHGAISGCL